jgi:hypothetical protein
MAAIVFFPLEEEAGTKLVRVGQEFLMMTWTSARSS